MPSHDIDTLGGWTTIDCKAFSWSVRGGAPFFLYTLRHENKSISDFMYVLPSNNRAANHRQFHVMPVTGALGADVEGVDLRTLNTQGYAELRQALLTHIPGEVFT